MAIQDDLRRLNFSWLLRLRWASIAGQLLLVVADEPLLHLGLPPVPALWAIALETVSNLVCVAGARQAKRIPEWALTVPIALDLILLTWLLTLTGGASNPFTVLYLVGVALAGVVVQSRWTWALVVLSLLCFGALYLAATPIGMEHLHSHPLRLHLKGMWLSFGLAAALIVYFVHHAMQVLSNRERALEQAHKAAARREKLASLAALSAGAAHELGTPLSTIALAAKELERHLERTRDEDALADARLIREQVERCRNILWQMAADAGASAGEPLEPLAVPALLSRVLGEVDEPSRVKVLLLPGTDGELLSAPPRALAYALKGLIKNALQASPPDAVVQVQVALDAQGWRMEVRDEGHGMSPEVMERAGEPFFTTKEPGRGMGLGLFLTNALMEQLGGRCELTSTLGEGTIATLVLPRSPGGAPALQAR